MKKLSILIITALLSVVAINAADRISRNVNDLPQAAQTFIKKYFNAGVNHIKIDSKLIGSTEYDVVLNNGTEIEFDSKGDWKEIDCAKNKEVPGAIILTDIKTYVQKNFKGKKIVQIKKEKNYYEIELSDGTELHFDRAGKFQRIDD